MIARLLFLVVTLLLGCGSVCFAATCRQEVGAVKSAAYVRDCIKASPATHPPCNALNACSLIIDEIKRGCAQMGPGIPAFCKRYK